MAITFLPQNRQQQYLLLLLGGIVFVGAGILWYYFIREEPPARFPAQPPPPQEVQIDFNVFQSPAFLELGEPRPPIPLLPPDEIGKPNPFAPTQ